MKERFTGDDGKRRLVESIKRQKLVQGDQAIAEALVDLGDLRDFRHNDVIIQEGAHDNEIYFIIAGEAEVIVNHRVVAIRTRGLHVGEMALIDEGAPRCATVRANNEVITLSVSESKFSEIAESHPILWRRTAIELAERLRQRNSLIKQPNARPHLFIGSSSESLGIARAIRIGLAHDDIYVKVWENQLFGPSSDTLEELEREVQLADFGVIVLSPDDQIISRDEAALAPRDNAIFELGMCMGALSRERSYFVHPRGVDLKMPTDLQGTTPLTYKAGPEGDYAADLADVVIQIRTAIQQLGVK